MVLPPEFAHLLGWATAASLLSVLGVLVGVPWMVGSLPSDYFVADRRSALGDAFHRRWFYPLLNILRNALGAVLLLLGIVMLFIPGQGLLTILAGLLLMNFPGKYRIERAVVGQPKVLVALNWIRARRGRPPLEAPAEH